MAAKKGNKKTKMGRPTRYRPEYAEQAKKLCFMGYTDVQLSNFFGVAESTIYKWKLDHKDFSEATRNGKDLADAEVVISLWERAKGYSHNDVHISTYLGEVTETPIVKHYPPDTGAAIHWLSNRQSDLFKIKQSTELTGKDGGPIVTKEDRSERLKELLEKRNASK